MEYVRVVERIDAPIAEIWAVISGFGALRTWMEVVESCALRGVGVGSVRTVKAFGAVTLERLVALDADTFRLEYVLEDPTILPASGIRSEMRLRAIGVNATELTWLSSAAEISVPVAQLRGIIEPFYRGSVVSLRRVFTSR